MENVPSQESQAKPGGNTKNPWQLYRWCFTLSMEECSASQLSQDLKNFCKEFVFSGEQGESGYKHWQGVFSLKNKEYFNTVKNMFPYNIHLEPCKHWWKARNYCKKDDTHIEGPYDQTSVFLKLPDKLYAWQQEIIDICNTEADDRTIHWYWEPEGCTGKTTLCKILYTMGATGIGNSGFKDIAQAIKGNEKIVFMNLTRDLEERVNYSAIEAVKDGLIFSAKYESGMKVFNSPHVFVFANWKPRIESMSKDRWNIVKVN